MVRLAGTLCFFTVPETLAALGVVPFFRMYPLSRQIVDRRTKGGNTGLP